MPKAKRLPSGNWNVTVYSHSDPVLDERGRPVLGPDGKPKVRRRYVSFTDPDRREAEYQAAEFKRSKARGRSAGNMTVYEAIDAYIASTDGVLSPTTVAGYRRIQRNHFPTLMHLPLRQVTGNALQQAVNDEAKRPNRRYEAADRKAGRPPRTLSPKTIANAYGLLVTALRHYLPDLRARVTLPAPRNLIKELLPPDVILDVIRGTDIELPCLLAMWLSFSLSEIRGLSRSKSLSPDGEFLTIRQVVVDVDGLPVVKDTGKEFFRIRRHRIPPYIKGLIDQGDPREDRLVPMSGQAIYKRWTRLLAQYGLPHMTFHDLRHVSASVMALLRVPDKYAQERGGWKTDKTMKRVYQQTFSPERDAVDHLINDYFETIIQDEMQNEKEKSP